MMSKTLALLLALSLVASVAMALPMLQEKSGTLITPPGFDTFQDTIKYDDGVIQWWYGGLSNYRLATKFTPLTVFEVQKIYFALTGTNPDPTAVNLWLKNDGGSVPGAIVWTGATSFPTSNTWKGVQIDTTGLYQYTAGQNFWLEVGSVGPPFEIYDNAQNPIRSLTWFGTSYGNSPGDNFIRAIGEYAGAIVDAGVDSVWHNLNFFAVNPANFAIGAKVKNYSTTPVSFAVACSLFTEVNDSTYNFFAALTQQNVMLAPNASANVNFPAFNWTVNNRYKIRVRSLLVGDVDPSNNTKEIETQIYTLPAELRYDDGLLEGSAYSSTAGDGWGMKFNPQQAGNYTITQFRVMVSTGTAAARIQLLDDNGAGGAPGTTLWETVMTLPSGWNTFSPNVTLSGGAFYISYIFENGANTPALSLDNYPSSGQGWTKNTGVWAADPAANDWMMRASIASPGAVPDVNITLTPYNPPIQIPAGGGTFDYNIILANNESTPQTFDAWIMVLLPNGSWYGPVLGPVNLTRPGNSSLNRDRSQAVPASAPAGTYTYRGYVGTYNTAKWDSSSFTFVKLTTGDGLFVGGWSNDGESFDPWVNDPVVETPTSFSLGSAYPNPFNPTTNIQFALPEASNMTLAVYNLNGSQVATLVNGYREAGNYTVTFDATGLTSGIYLYRLTAGNFSAMNKMVLVK